MTREPFKIRPPAPAGITVTLSWREVLFAAIGGVYQNIAHASNGSAEKHGQAERGRDWQSNIEGALGEMVIAKLTDSYWRTPIPKDQLPAHNGDVARFEVRTTSLDHGGLILHHTDHDDRCYALVTGRAPTFRIVGWIRGADGKTERFWNTTLPHPAFLVPQWALESFRDVIGNAS